MKSIEIAGKIRQDVGKKDTKKIRREGNVPCVLYGGSEIKHFYAHELAFKDLVYSHAVFIVHFDLDGTKHKAVMREIQFHPVRENLLHIDFVEVFDDKPVIINVPINLTGSSVGLKKGGKLRIRRRSLKVKGLPKYLPDVLNIDISDVDIGQTIKIGDLEFDNLEILDPHRAMVVAVVSSRIVAKGMEEGEVAPAETPEVAEGAEVAEGEAAEKAEGEEATGEETKSEN